MKRYFTIAVAVLIGLPLLAQTTAEDFNAKYLRQVKAVGTDGPGVEPILEKWEAAFPDDAKMLDARFLYDYEKSLKTEVIRKDQARYLGNKPVLSLPDSTGTNVNYFEDNVFDDELFGASQQYIDKAIKLCPDEISYRFHKLAALLAYEKESPDMATSELNALIDYNLASKPSWTYEGEPFSKEDFDAAVQEYCFSFYKIGSANGYEAFKALSEKMNKLDPKATVYLTNLGSYWLVAQDNDKKAASYYKKALKIDPQDQTALANMKIIEKRKSKK